MARLPTTTHTWSRWNPHGACVHTTPIDLKGEKLWTRSGAPSSSARSALIIALSPCVFCVGICTALSYEDIRVPLRHGCVFCSAESPPSRWKEFLACTRPQTAGNVFLTKRPRLRWHRVSDGETGEGSMPCVESRHAARAATTKSMGRREEPASGIQLKAGSKYKMRGTTQKHPCPGTRVPFM